MMKLSRNYQVCSIAYPIVPFLSLAVCALIVILSSNAASAEVVNFNALRNIPASPTVSNPVSAGSSGEIQILASGDGYETITGFQIRSIDAPSGTLILIK